MLLDDEVPGILTREGGATIAYRHSAGKAPGVIFLGGFMSDMGGTKARTLHEFCLARGQAFLRFDYFGHGASSGDFADATVGRWQDDALAVIDHLTQGPQVLVGSSIGGWLMLLAALARPTRIAALVGIAAAPDATEALMWQRFPDAVRAAILRDGAARIPFEYAGEGYLITRALIEDGRRHLLPADGVPLACPVRLIHGIEDRDVPWRVSLELAARIRSSDVHVILLRTLEPLLGLAQKVMT
jgi:pimeloyl-ACP methyl ester carboxylesterase